jgi:hypothetical protein
MSTATAFSPTPTKRRAEKSLRRLARTFVDAEPLFIQLSSRNHQVFYGRRGTGKTHALKFLAESIGAKQEKPIYVNLRSVGFNGSIYSDGKRSLAERASRLIIDDLEAIEQEVMQLAVELIDGAPDPAQITIRLDDLSEAIRAVEVRGPIEEEQTVTGNSENNALVSGKLGPKTAEVSAALGEKVSCTTATRTKRSGDATISIDFGTLQTALSGLVDVLGYADYLVAYRRMERNSDRPPAVSRRSNKTHNPSATQDHCEDRRNRASV